MNVIKRQEQTPDSRVVVFDLDHTICIPNLEFDDVYSRYFEAKPIEKTILKMKQLEKRGWYIIINTARGMKSCNGDGDKAFEKNAMITTMWLHKHEVPWHTLIFGKPLAEYYVDDRAVYIEDMWKI